MMHICGGLEAPRSEHVEKTLVLPLFFEGSREPKGRQEYVKFSEPDRFFGRKKVAKKGAKRKQMSL